MVMRGRFYQNQFGPGGGSANGGSEYILLVQKVRSLPKDSRVLVRGAQGVVESTNEQTLTIYVSFGGMKAMGLHVSVVEPANR